MILKNASVCTGDFRFVNTDVTIENEIITSLEKTDAEGIDCTGKKIIPGFIDIHIHGCNNSDATDGKADSVANMSKFLATKGVTSFCPTTMTLSKEALKKSFEYAKNAMGNEVGAYIHGINMEGPFISKAKKGAQAEEYVIAPDFDFFNELNSICPVKLVDIAPETEGADKFIEKAKSICKVSVAHTTADYNQTVHAFEKGISHSTHLFNAMTPFTSREPGVVGAVFDNNFVTAEMICDGIHIASPALRVAFSILGKDRTVVISDAMMAAGLEDGEYELGGQRVIKKGAARLADGTLAGSVTNLHEEFNNLLSFGIDEEQALRSVTINPARVIGADKFTGSIEKGKNADILVISEDYKHIYNVYIKGKQAI